MTRVLLVGGGLTSSVVGTLLRRELPHAELVLWDKARGAGKKTLHLFVFFLTWLYCILQ